MLNNLTAFFSTGENILFILLSLLVIGGAMYMISFTKVVHMVVSLAFTFISLAGIYIMLEAEFVAIVQILIYAGAITILMVFGIMMTKHQDADAAPKRPLHNSLLFVGVLGLFGILFYAIQQSNIVPVSDFQAAEDNTRAIGEQLYTLHVIPFELVSVLLTVAFIGAIVLAKREEE
jgi:NADH-quinone oxidoreductase subunit J